MRFWTQVFLLFVAFSNAFAIHVAVLETVADERTKEDVSLSDRQYLTNVLREQAVKELPAEQNYTIMTRDNIQQMLPPGMAMEECEGSCLVETGKNISADFICQARVGSFGGSLTLSAELYETAGNKLIASFNGRGTDVNALLELIEIKSPEFFRRVKNLTDASSEEKKESTAILNPDTVAVDTAKPGVKENSTEVPAVDENKVEKLDTAETKPAETNAVRNLAEKAYSELDGNSSARAGESVPTNVETKKSSTARWVIFGISSATAVAGGVLAVVGDRKAKEGVEKGENEKSMSVLEKNRKEVQSWQTLRNIGIGVAILGVVGAGVSFAF